MLAGFALYQQPREAWDGAHDGALDRNTIATPPGTRLMRIIRLPRGWRCWLATRDFVYGTYIELFNDGRIMHMTTRCDEGDEFYWTRPADGDV